MKKTVLTLIAVLCVSAIASQSIAGGVKYKNEDGDYLKLGGRIQLQYHMEDPDGGDSTDELRFRRFRPYIEGSVTEDWKGKFQFDLGKGKVALKDAYMKYGGFEYADIALGNVTFPFSLEQRTSSKKQQLVERTFVGDHNYGVPDRQAGIHLSGSALDHMLDWGVAVAKAAQDPSNKKLDFDTTIQIDAGGDWSEGEMVGGRLDIYPMGYFKPSQGDFGREFKAVIGAAAFTWANDEDNLDSARSNDVDSVTGAEVHAGVRGMGLSVDAQYNMYDAELVDAGITDGLYENSETTLEAYAIEGGYMVVPSKVELVAGYQSQDADNYAKSWNRTSVGANYFHNKHNVKYQLTYRMGENKDGVDGKDVDELFVQAQYVF